MDQLEFAIEFLHERLSDGSVDDFELYASTTQHLQAEARDGQVESFSRSLERGVALRVVKDGRLGMSSTGDLSAEELSDAVAHAVAAAQEAQESEGARFPAPRTEVEALAERPGRPLSEISDEEKIEAAKRLERAVLAADPRVVRARTPIYTETSKRVILMNSQDVLEKGQRSVVSCRVQAVAERDGSSEMAWEYDHHIRFDDLDCEGIGRRAGQRAAALLGAKPVPTGRYDVYFEPRAASQMLRILMPSFFAENVQRHKSRLADKRDQQAFSPSLTIVDDGLLPGGAGSFLFDGEGVVHQRTPVVSDGYIRGWLYDGASAYRDGVFSTGNAQRGSIHAAPQIAVTNSFIMEGSKDPAELVRSCDGGLLVSDLMGLHTANTVSGDFSLGAVGFLVENGVRGRPVRGVMVAGNIMDLFKSVKGVGSDLGFFGQFGSPSLLVGNVQVDGS